MTKKDSTDKLLSIITKSAEGKKATDPVILDITRKGRIIDFMVIVSGESTPHLKAIAKEIEAQVKKLGIVGTIWEGTVDSGWLIFDLGSILVHIMSEKERKYYNLEELWGKEAVVYH